MLFTVIKVKINGVQWTLNKANNPIQQKKKLDTNRFVEDKTFDNFAIK